MKKLFTIDNIMVAFVAALGYGFGETFSRLWGWPTLLCMAASMAFGIVTEGIVNRIVFSKAVQKSAKNRILTYMAVILIFVIAHMISMAKLGVSMLGYLEEQVVYTVGFPILGFVVNLLIRAYRIQKVREVYGDGSKGYVFDVDNEDVEAFNRQNQRIYGEYDAGCAVTTRTGIYAGERHNHTVSYLGIPYAKPPVGERRWKAPEPLSSSEAVFEAKNFGASAIQVEHRGSIVKHHRQSEDCLTLNICVGEGAAESKKPVLVLFHHGDFSYGGAVDPLLYGANYVSKHPDIVFVSFNYRLGILGFIDFSEVPGGQTCPDALNLGLLDQVAALKWIRENIAAFGGDPDRITALGFESGATSILLLAASGRAKGLFQRAFVFNGSPESAYDAPQASRALARDLLRETQTATMAELMQLDTEALKHAAQQLWRDMPAPTCDGTWIPSDLYAACQAGAASGIEFIIGIPNNETKVYQAFIGDPKYEKLIDATVAGLQGELDASGAGGIQAFIEAQTAASGALEAKSKLVEQWNALCVYRVAASLAEGGNTVHLMYWNEKPLIEKLGSGTVDAVAALLGNRDALQMYGSVLNADLSETLQALLQKFVSGETLQLYHNEINGIDAIDWEAFPKALIVSAEKFQCDTMEGIV